MVVAEEYFIKRNSAINNHQLKVSESNTTSSRSNSNCGLLAINKIDLENGEWRLINFYEWFFKLAELVNKNFVQMWNDGYFLEVFYILEILYILV